jgi:hypothetical protein
VPVTRGGLQELEELVYRSNGKYIKYVKKVKLDAASFIHDHGNLFDGPAATLNQEAFTIVERRSFAICLPQLSSLQRIAFLPPHLEKSWSETIQSDILKQWDTLIESLLPEILKGAPKVCSIAIEDLFYYAYQRAPSYQTHPCLAGVSSSVFDLIFRSELSFEALSKLRLSIRPSPSLNNEDSAAILRRRLPRLKALKSLDFSFSGPASQSRQFFQDFVQDLSQMSIQHFGITCLKPQPDSLPLLLTKCPNIQSFSLLLIHLTQDGWTRLLEQLRSQPTLVSLELQYLNIDKKGLDFAKFPPITYEPNVDEPVLTLKTKNHSINVDIGRLQAYHRLRRENWKVRHVIQEDA